ncbi:MAG: hypothetical protein LBH49_01375 [Puniceicoccales bacterium]|jgi:hypothetical protein|nr:hypothetical protein [Puniceicoccales bacterium]
MDYDITVDFKKSTDQISMINDYLDAVNHDTNVLEPTISTIETFGIISELMTNAFGNIDLSGFKTVGDSLEIMSVAMVEHHGNEPKVDTGDNDGDGIINCLDGEDDSVNIKIDSDGDGITDDIDATGSASNTNRSHDSKGAALEQAKSSLISSIMSLLQFNFTMALGDEDPKKNEANKIGAMAQTSLGITSNVDAKVQSPDNGRNVQKEMRQHKADSLKAMRKNLENEVLTNTKPSHKLDKTRFKKFDKSAIKANLTAANNQKSINFAPKAETITNRNPINSTKKTSNISSTKGPTTNSSAINNQSQEDTTPPVESITSTKSSNLNNDANNIIRMI